MQQRRKRCYSCMNLYNKDEVTIIYVDDVKKYLCDWCWDPTIFENVE